MNKWSAARQSFTKHSLKRSFKEWCMQAPLPTSVVQRAVEIEAASVVASHELDQVPYPGVACTRKTRKSHQGAGSVRQKHPLFAPGV